MFACLRLVVACLVLAVAASISPAAGSSPAAAGTGGVNAPSAEDKPFLVLISIDGIAPSHWRAFDASVPGEARVEQALDWLSLPAARNDD